MDANNTSPSPPPPLVHVVTQTTIILDESANSVEVEHIDPKVTDIFKDLEGLFFKVVVLGDSGTGKTAIVTRLASGTYKAGSVTTIGVDVVYLDYLVTFNNKKYSLKVALWDTAGQERYAPISALYSRDAKAALLVYDLSDVSSFTNIRTKWIDKIRQEKQIIPILVGNKSDLPTTNKQVCASQWQEYASTEHMIGIETSAKDNINVSTALEALIKVCVAKTLKSASPVSLLPTSTTLSHPTIHMPSIANATSNSTLPLSSSILSLPRTNAVAATTSKQATPIKLTATDLQQQQQQKKTNAPCYC